MRTNMVAVIYGVVNVLVGSLSFLICEIDFMLGCDGRCVYHFV